MEAYRHQRQLLSLTRKCSGKGDHKQKYQSQDIKGDILWCCWSHSTQLHLPWITDLHEPWHSFSLVVFLLSSPGYIFAIYIQIIHNLLSCLDFLFYFISAFQHCFPCWSPHDNYIKDWMKMTMFWCSMPHKQNFSTLCSLGLWLVYCCVHGSKWRNNGS